MFDLSRVQGCASQQNILGFLFDEIESEHITPLKLETSCKMRYAARCNMENCHRYRIGTKGFTRISWDQKGKTM